MPYNDMRNSEREREAVRERVPKMIFEAISGTPTDKQLNIEAKFPQNI